jgi:hypothetical protein
MRCERHSLLLLLLAAVACASLSSHFVAAANGQCGVALCFAIDESSSQTAAGFALSTAFVKALVRNISAISSEWVAAGRVFGLALGSVHLIWWGQFGSLVG